MNRPALQQGFLGLEGAAMYLVIAMAVLLVASWAASGAAVWYLDGKVESANKDAREAQAALGRERQARQTDEEAAKACSASVALLEATASAQEIAAAKARATNQELSKAVQGHIQAMLNRPRPTGLDECQAMKKELDDEIDERAGRLPPLDGRQLPRT